MASPASDGPASDAQEAEWRAREGERLLVVGIGASAGGLEGPLVMPDLRGLSMGRVVDVMGRYSVKLSLAGTGVARQQSPAPGAGVLPGAECVVTFSGDRGER